MSPRGRLLLPGLAVPLAALLAVAALAGPAAAAPSPFGIATPDGGGALGWGGPFAGLFAWIAVHQAGFYRTLTASLSAMKESGNAPWLLIGVSFVYGIFHAAGPGHGKAVISSYLLASGETVRRGIAIAFASALLQALVAVALVAAAVLLFRATAMAITRVTDWAEIASYALIALAGGWVLAGKLFGFARHRHRHPVAAPVAAPAAMAAAGLGSPFRADGGEDDLACLHPGCGHDHSGVAAAMAMAGGRSPTLLGSLGRAAAAIASVGIRPCSGAVIVLVFALSQGIFAAGIASTFVMALGTGMTVALLATLAVSARGLALRAVGGDAALAGRIVLGLEILAALLILLFGLALLGGALAQGLP